MPTKSAILIFFFGFLISDVIKVTLFQVIEANNAPTILIPTSLKVSKLKVIWLFSSEKFCAKTDKFGAKNIQQKIIAKIERTFVIVKIFWTITPALIPLELINVIIKTVIIAKSC